MHSEFLAWPRSAKRFVVIALDVVLAVIATWVAYSLRLDSLHNPVDAQWWVYGIAPILAIPIFVKFGLYRAIFRYTGQAALVATGKAVFLYALILSSLLMWHQWPMVPRSLGLLQPLVFLVLVGASRAFARFWLAEMSVKKRGSLGRLLIYGAGAAGAQTAAALAVTRQYELVGFVDDDDSMTGRSLNDSPVFSAKKLTQLVQAESITDILLAMPNAPRERRNHIIASLSGIPVHVRTLPSMADLASGKVAVQDFRELEIEDLLGRDPVPPLQDLLSRELRGKVVLITGAGGSIGSELARQIAAQKPTQLLLLDHNEFGLYSIHQELQAILQTAGDAFDLVPLLGSVSNVHRLREILVTYRPDIVYHAAAYKHVPIVEGNPGEGVINNVFGTLNSARASMECGVARFVLVSTDKAVRPTNIMGASKRVAELVLQALGAGQVGTCFSMVRFGNVLGSSGSVVPLFRKQLAEGGPLTVTHEDVTRYFMTIPEAAQLVLQAGAMGEGGDLFVLDMGQPVQIMKLARRMIELSGLTVRDRNRPDGDIEIVVTGLRPGEKLYEELLIGDNPSATEHPRILRAHEPFVPWSEIESELSSLYDSAKCNDVTEINAFLLKYVQGYQHA